LWWLTTFAFPAQLNIGMSGVPFGGVPEAFRPAIKGNANIAAAIAVTATRYRLICVFHGCDATASQLHEKSAFSIHALTGSRTTGLPDYTGERAQGGRVLLTIHQAEACRLPWLHTTLENVWYYFR